MQNSWDRMTAFTVIEKLKKISLTGEEINLLAKLFDPVVPESIVTDALFQANTEIKIPVSIPEPVVYKSDQPSGNVVTLEVEKSREGEHKPFSPRPVRDDEAYVGEVIPRRQTEYENQCGMDFTALCLQ